MGIAGADGENFQLLAAIHSRGTERRDGHLSWERESRAISAFQTNKCCFHLSGSLARSRTRRASVGGISSLEYWYPLEVGKKWCRVESLIKIILIAAAPAAFKKKESSAFIIKIKSICCRDCAGLLGNSASPGEPTAYPCGERYIFTFSVDESKSCMLWMMRVKKIVLRDEIVHGRFLFLRPTARLIFVWACRWTG